MTAMSSVSVSSDCDVSIAGELIDALIEAMVIPPDRRVRAAVISALVQEMCTAVEWLHVAETRPAGEAAEAADDELNSLKLLGVAAHDHEQRMAALGLAGRVR